MDNKFYRPGDLFDDFFNDLKEKVEQNSRKNFNQKEKIVFATKKQINFLQKYHIKHDPLVTKNEAMLKIREFLSP